MKVSALSFFTWPPDGPTPLAKTLCIPSTTTYDAIDFFTHCIPRIKSSLCLESMRRVDRCEARNADVVLILLDRGYPPAEPTKPLQRCWSFVMIEL